MMLSLDTAYRSFGGEVEASNTPTICRLPDSRRHQLSAIARLSWRPLSIKEQCWSLSIPFISDWPLLIFALAPFDFWRTLKPRCSAKELSLKVGDGGNRE